MIPAIAMDKRIDRVSRLVDVNGRNLQIYEHTEMENEAGAVVWDAALVLLNYICKGTSLALLAHLAGCQVSYSTHLQTPL